jgi:hypothetical protein
MATTTASITLQSSGIGSNALSLTKTMTLNKLGTTTGLDQTTGLSKVVTEAVAESTLLNSVIGPRAGFGSKNGKVFIKNCSTTDTEYIIIKIHDTIMGRLYAGDWTFFPWSESDADGDITITPSVATPMTIEYMHIHEGITLTAV